MADESFQVTRFKIYGLLFNPEGGINDAGDGKKEKWASIPAAKPSVRPSAKQPTGKTPKQIQPSSSGGGEEEEEEDDDDEYEYEYEYSVEEEVTEYTYEVIEVSDDEDDNDVKVINLGDEDAEEVIHVYYDDDLFIGFKVKMHTTTKDIIRQGHKKLHLRSNAVQFSLFIIKNGTDIRKLHDDEEPLLRLRRYENMDIKFAFLSTMSSFNMRMRNYAFQKWLSWKLSLIGGCTPAEASVAAINSPPDPKKTLHVDLSDGLVLMDLLTVLDFPHVAKFNKKPKTVKDKLKNIAKALSSFRASGCIIPEHVTPDQIHKGNSVAVLDLLWGIIYRSHAPKITESSMEFLFMDELLYWCLSHTKDLPGINEDNIHASLCDGLAWCGLVHKFEPEALNYQMAFYAATKLNRKASETCKLAFDAATKCLAVPQLLDPRAFDRGTIDELSLIIALACWYDVKGNASEKEKTEKAPVGEEGPKDKKDKKKLAAEEKRKEEERKVEKRQEDIRRRQEEVDQRLNEEARKEEEKLAKARKKEKEKLERQKRKNKGGNVLTIPLLFQGFEDDFVTFRTYACDKSISVPEAYEMIAKDLGIKSEDFVLSQRKKGGEVFATADEERLLFKEKDKFERCLICTKKTALKPEQVEACKKKKP